jgi:hypothetical protein
MEDLEDAANGDDQPPAAGGNDLPKFDEHQSRKRLQFEDDEGEDHEFLDD